MFLRVIALGFLIALGGCFHDSPTEPKPQVPFAGIRVASSCPRSVWAYRLDRDTLRIAIFPWAGGDTLRLDVRGTHDLNAWQLDAATALPLGPNVSQSVTAPEVVVWACVP